MIDCKICFKTYKTLTGSHLATHGFSVADYKEEFRVKYIHSAQARQKIGILKLGHTFNRGRKFKFPKEHLKKSSQLMKVLNKDPWNRMKISRTLKGNKNALGHRLRKGFKKKMSRLMKGNKNAKGWVAPADFRKKVSLRFKKLWANPTWRKKLLRIRALNS